MKILLVPGFPDFTGLEFFPHQYFRGVGDMLTALGFEVAIAKLKPFDDISHRAAQIKDTIEHDPKLQDARKIHIIAHSAGGVDARLVVSPEGLKMAGRIRSITTIGTPHRGTVIADLATGALSAGGGILDALKQRFPHLEEGVKELTTAEMARFNQKFLNAPGVDYFSYAGVLGPHRILQGAVLAVTQPLFAPEGANDGWVSFRSAHWGEFKSTVAADHAELIGYDLSAEGLLPFGFPSSPFDHLSFYRRIAGELVPLGE